mmetsp:Transcript_34875/g.56466  ORF Transcript_34875/g.56466 Transcript_34875/m.56466 type:complete len:91 (+) Transcript_34875:603-875(+)|eukprot:CAMPEP_0184675608 /NCGR_PEP_ID=MMETSP0308-20130426/87874_1 /TAXON_ID=38269 /ORGANISM="Gloeochaete witrockiana, Strain SAG 46.84" /LENGTH=90 /DNA_ID=CAMNT_0027123327 /DNA_START=1359 /DNA_END=1631 /DNA_ORIENTATION=-
MYVDDRSDSSAVAVAPSAEALMLNEILGEVAPSEILEDPEKKLKGLAGCKVNRDADGDAPKGVQEGNASASKTGDDAPLRDLLIALFVSP